MSKNIFSVIKTCALISNSLFQSVKLSTLYSALNLQCWWKRVSIKQILRTYPWQNYKNFNWNRSFIWPTLHFAWLTLAFWSRKTPNTVMNFWLFRRQSTPNASQTWLQSNEYCAHLRGNIISILTEIGYLNVQKYFRLIKTCTLISNSLFYSDELNCDIFAGSQSSMPVKHGFDETKIALMSVEKLNLF